MDKERFEQHLKHDGALRLKWFGQRSPVLCSNNFLLTRGSEIGWNDFLGVACFIGDENIIRSGFTEHNALLSELTELLSNEALLDRMYTQHLVYKSQPF